MVSVTHASLDLATHAAAADGPSRARGRVVSGLVTTDGGATALGDLERLYEDNAEMVRRAVLRLHGPGADVDDLVHDVFLVALRRGGSFEGRSSASTWLYGIAIKVVATARRRERVRRMLSFSFALEGDDAAEPVENLTPARLFEHREASRAVYRILDRIVEKKRAVFVLYELEGLSGEEIAEAVGCPLKTVWTRLHHARKEFTQHLDREALREQRLAARTATEKR